jgi:hypothetical protein
MFSITFILSLVVLFESIAIVIMVLRMHRHKKHYKEVLNKIYRAYNTSYRQMKGMQSLFDER